MADLKKIRFIIYAGLLLAASSCNTLDIHEKNMPIPGHAWESDFQPELHFNITDTIASYQIFLVIRHTDAYRFNNIWVNISSKSPGDTSYTTQKFDFPLANAEGWTASGIDDLYEHRILLYPQPVKFKRTGTYSVRLEQIMREDPLRHILSAGLRVEKIKG